MSALNGRIRGVLDRVYDPCSLAQRNPMSLIDMGLVLGWDLDEEGHLEVRMCVTSACCTMAPHFTEAARRELEKLPEVHSVEVVVEAGFFWTPDRMTVRGKARLAERRRATVAVTGVKPMQWKEAAHVRP
jgi:metal-sulfur cluster biosynthetic enzyme